MGEAHGGFFIRITGSAKKVKEEDDNIKPMKEFESPEKLYDELIASVRKVSSIDRYIADRESISCCEGCT